MKNQSDPTFKLACVAIVAGIIAAFGSAWHSARGLETQIAVASVDAAQR